MGTIKKIYILHGWAYSTEKWQELVNLLKENNYEPVILQIPGLTIETDKIWTLNDYVDWLYKIIGQETAIIIGHSNGGRIALAYAAKYPEKLNHLILIDSAGIYHNELPIRIKRKVFGMLAKIGSKITNSPKLRNLLYKVAREADYLKASPQMKKTMVNLISVDLTAELVKIIVPTLIIWGRNDKSTPLSDGRTMHKHIKDSKLVVVDNARHSPQFTHVQEVYKSIIKEI